MKKLFKNVLAIGCAATAALSLAACSGESAYDLAVKDGFQGDEWQWLQSLKGLDGEDGQDLDISAIYEEAKTNGFKGTFLDFLKEYLSVDVKDNNDTAQISENMMSVVSIHCGFSRIVSGGGWWGSSTVEYYMASGSGVIVDLDTEAGSALVVTNYHVLYDAASTARGISDCIYLYTYGGLNKFSPQTGDQGGDGMKATYIGGAMDYDIALLLVEDSDFLKDNETVREAEFGDSESVVAGENVFAIGNPEGAGISVTSGVISVESEYITMNSTDGQSYVSYRVMRTDAAINGGTSGGALFNAEGKLIGITNAKNVGEETDNMGFALPITQVKYIIENIQDNGGVVKRAILGSSVAVKSSSAAFDNSGHIEITEKLHVTKPSLLSSTADYNCFEEFDVLEWLQLGNGMKHTLTREYQLSDLLLTVRRGDVVTFGVIRDGVSTTVTVKFDKESYFRTYR